MHIYALLMVASLSTGEVPPVAAVSTEPVEATPSSAAVVDGATPPPAPPVITGEEVQPEKPKKSVREKALSRSKVPRYPKLDRPQVLIPAAAGVGLALAGGYFYRDALIIRKELDEGRYPHRGAVQDAMQSGRRSQLVAILLGGASVLSVGAATYFYLQPLPGTNAKLTLVPAEGGAFATLSGVLP